MRRKKELDKIDSLLNVTEEKVLKIKKTYDSNRKTIDEEFNNMLRNLFKIAIKMQKDKIKLKIKYIVFSLLRVNIKNEIYEVRVDLYDHKKYLDETECSINWNASFIFNINEEDIKGFYCSNNVGLKNLKKYEVYYLREKFMEMNIGFLGLFLRNKMPKVLNFEEYKLLEKEEVIEVTVGEYLDIDYRIVELKNKVE